MRPGPKDTGWCGSLFPEPIEQVKAPWASKPVDTFAGAAFRQPAPKIESNQDEGLDFSKEWYYCASGNAIRNHLPCGECIRSEPREEIHCIRFFKLHPCAYFNSAHCNGSTCEYWDHKTITCTYGPYLAWLAAMPVVDVAPPKPKSTAVDVLAAKVRLMPVDPKTETIEDLAKHLTQIAERDGEKILEKVYGVSIGMTAAAAVEAIKAASRDLTGDNVAMFLKNEGHLGTRTQRRDAAVEIMREVGNWSEWHRPLRMPEYSFATGAKFGEKPEHTEAEAHGDDLCSGCLCHKCDYSQHICQSCEDPAACATRGKHTVACPEFSGLKKASRKELAKAKKPAKLRSADYNGNALPGSNADICSHCDCETCGLNQDHLDYTDKTWKDCPPCGCDQCLGKDELQPTTLCGRKSSLTVEVMGNTESCLPREQLHVDTVQRYVRPAECAEGSCTACQCQTCGYRNLNCALNGDEPVLVCSACWLNHPHHWKVYAAIVTKCPHWRDGATFPADILAPGMGPCPETACELLYNGEGGPCLCHSCKHGTPDCDSTCGVPGYPMETGQYACEWYAPKVATPEGPTPELDALAAELDVQMMKTAALALSEALRPTHGQNYWDVPDLVKVGDLVTRLHARGYIYEIRKVTRVEKTDAGWQIYGDLWDDFRHPRRKQVSKDEPIIRYEVGWKAEDGKVVPMGQKVVEVSPDTTYEETYADERLIVLTLEQVAQLVAVEEAEDVNGPTWYTHIWLKPEKAKGHKNEQGYLEDPRKRWPLLGHARFVDTSAAAVARTPSGRRSEVCQDEPECEVCHCHTCQHQKDCRLDNTLNPCSPCKTSGGAHHHKAVDCEGCTP